MKISKRQLRRIIKEEKARLLKESTRQAAEERLTNALQEYVSILDEDMGYDIPLDHLKAEVMNIVDGHFQFLEDYQKNPENYQ